jgi:DNA-binding NtrC family response regulator
LTTIGSDRSADLRLATLPPRWAIVQRDGDALVVRPVGTDEIHRIRAGEQMVIHAVTLAVIAHGEDLTPGLPVQQLIEALCGVEDAAEALRTTLRGVIRATAADVGAIIISERDGYTVAVAEDREERGLDDAEELLSDTIVRDVLTNSAAVCVRDAASNGRYAHVPSVMALKLRSVLCVPMVLSGRVLGAFFLGRHDVRVEFSARHASDLTMLAALVIPLLVQIRRVNTRSGLAADHLVGECPAIAEVRRLIERIGPSDLSVLIQGETGTGKEVAARAIHAASHRAHRTSVALNCSAVPEGLLGSELFGCKKGAFTGAVSDRKGRIEEADGSTLFLDEVGDMPLAMQAMLLRALEEREVTRIGENTPRHVDFRLVAATHKNLDAEVAAGRFREDLLFRIREITIVLPPLAARGDDVHLLAQLFLRQAEAQFGLGLHRIGDAAKDMIERHRWPGNVRELRAAMRRAALLCDGNELRTEDLKLEPEFGTAPPPSALPPPPKHRLLSAPPDANGAQPAAELGDLDRTLDAARDEFVSRYVSSVLARHGGNRERAAVALGISVRSLYRLVG